MNNYQKEDLLNLLAKHNIEISMSSSFFEELCDFVDWMYNIGCQDGMERGQEEGFACGLEEGKHLAN